MLIKRTLPAVLIATSLSSCGGGAVIGAFSFVAPIGGNFLSIGRDPILDVNFTENNFPGEKNTPSGSVLIKGIADFPLPDACSDALQNSELTTELVEFSEQKFVAYLKNDKKTECWYGEYIDIHKLRIDSVNGTANSQSILAFREPALHMKISEGVWINAENKKQWFKFVGDLKDGEILKGCEVVDGINKQNGIAVDLWVYNSPYNEISGSRQPTVPHLKEVGGNKTANFSGFSLLEISDNHQALMSFERASADENYQKDCSI